MIGAALLTFALAAYSAVIAVRPRSTWRALAGWQFKDPDSAELTTTAAVIRSASGGVSALFLLGLGVWCLVLDEPGGSRCERTMSALAEAAAGVDFDRSTLEEIGDDLSARFDLDIAAAGLDVELEEHGESVDVVTEDGDVLGTIDESGVESRCD